MRDEYISRINRVLDYIDANLDKQLRLDTLAGVAHFSPYHFHRIFKGVMGEPLNRFIQRLRLEKAALQLINNPKKSITEIALDCGFSGSAPFARAFKDGFGISAGKWRAGGYRDFSKIRQTNSKIEQEVSADSHYSSPNDEQFAWRNEMSKQQNQKFTADVTVKELPEMNVVYVRHVGPYKGDSALFEGLFQKIMTWAGTRGLFASPDLKIMSVYHDDPEITDQSKLRTSVCVTAPKDTVVDGEIGMMTVPGGNYAVTKFELAGDEFEDAWNSVFGGWLPGSGYQPDDGPCYELYYNNPKEHPEGKCIVEICVPVKPL